VVILHGHCLHHSTVTVCSCRHAWLLLSCVCGGCVMWLHRSIGDGMKRIDGCFCLPLPWQACAKVACAHAASTVCLHRLMHLVNCLCMLLCNTFARELLKVTRVLLFGLCGGVVARLVQSRLYHPNLTQAGTLVIHGCLHCGCSTCTDLLSLCSGMLRMEPTGAC
jgi:hypothetical protein